MPLRGKAFFSRHLVELVEPVRDRDYHGLLGEIAKELGANEALLEAADLRFLAVLHHGLNERTGAQECYGKALAAYAAARARKQPSVMEALCHSDYGDFAMELRGDMELAIAQFDHAYRLVKQEHGASKDSHVCISPFCISLRCRKADAWQRLKVWGESNSDLDVALQLALDLDKKGALAAYVHRRRAWACMEQWRFGDATDEFKRSNEILKEEPDLVSRVAEFHNLHGLSMAKRFQGEPAGAVRDYRLLVNRIAAEFRTQTERRQDDFAVHDIKALLAERYVNSHERLVDCNLFGPPDVRDLAAAIDDVRRGLRGCARLMPHRRVIAEAGMHYRQALALALPSPAQDAELAADCCAAAEKLYEQAAKPGELNYHHVLVPALVGLFAVPAKKAEPEARARKLASLRQAIVALRAEISENANRDQLEFLMFASKLLIEEGLESDSRFLMLQDAERLQGFCRKVLHGRNNETASYLRPYYETVLKARLKLSPRQVKELLEVQWEATMGSPYSVPVDSQTTLALFVMDGKVHLFMDVPREAGKVFSLEGSLTLEELREAALPAKAKLKLPREALRELEKWARAESATPLRIHWRDPVRGLGATPRASETPSTLAHACPFEFPAT